MSLVNYEGDSSEDEDQGESSTVTAIVKSTRQMHLPAPSHAANTTRKESTIEDIDDDDDYHHEHSNETTHQTSSNLLRNLPRPQQEENSSKSNLTTMEFPESDLEDIVRGENKEYAKNLPTLPKPIKRKRDGPVKIFLPTLEQDLDEEEKPKRKQTNIKRNCALLNELPPPMYDEDKPVAIVPVVKNPSANTPQISSTGLFIPYTVNKKKTTKSNPTPESTKNPLGLVDADDDDDDDDTTATDFLGLTKSEQVNISNSDVENVLRETFPKARPMIPEQPIQPQPIGQFEDLDEIEEETNSGESQSQVLDDEDELLRYLPKSERYKEIKSVHIDSMIGDSARLQLLKNTTEERETMLAQAAIHVPKGEVRKRAQITYLVAKAQHDDLKLKNMWSEQKLTKRQTQAKYGF